MKSKLMEEQSCNAVAAENGEFMAPPSSSSSLPPLPYSHTHARSGVGGGHGNDDVYGMMLPDNSHLPDRSKKYLREKEVSFEGDDEKEGNEGEREGEGGGHHHDGGDEEEDYDDDDTVDVDGEEGEEGGGDGAGGGTNGKRARNGGLMEAVLHGNEGNLGRMLGERKADVDVIDQGGATPLMLAAQTGKVDMVQLLLDYNASVTARTTVARNSVMHFAAKNGSEAVIKLLMERDATLLDSPNKNLDTPLMMAVLARKYITAPSSLPPFRYHVVHH